MAAAGAGHAPAFVKDVLGMMIANRGDDLPVSAMPVDGTFPTATTQYEKRSIAQDIPIWDAEDLHPVRALLAGLPARLDPHEGLRSGAAWPGPRRASRPRTRRARSIPAGSSPSRWRPTIAPAAACASTSARPRTRSRSSTRPSTWSRSSPHLERERANFDFFLTHSRRRPHARSSSTRSRARSCCCRCSSSPGPAPAAARRPTSSCSRSSSATAC